MSIISQTHRWVPATERREVLSPEQPGEPAHARSTGPDAAFSSVMPAGKTQTLQNGKVGSTLCPNQLWVGCTAHQKRTVRNKPHTCSGEPRAAVPSPEDGAAEGRPTPRHRRRGTGRAPLSPRADRLPEAAARPDPALAHGLGWHGTPPPRATGHGDKRPSAPRTARSVAGAAEGRSCSPPTGPARPVPAACRRRPAARRGRRRPRAARPRPAPAARRAERRPQHPPASGRVQPHGAGAAAGAAPPLPARPHTRPPTGDRRPSGATPGPRGWSAAAPPLRAGHRRPPCGGAATAAAAHLPCRSAPSHPATLPGPPQPLPLRHYSCSPVPWPARPNRHSLAAAATSPGLAWLDPDGDAHLPAATQPHSAQLMRPPPGPPRLFTAPAAPSRGPASRPAPAALPLAPPNAPPPHRGGTTTQERAESVHPAPPPPMAGEHGRGADQWGGEEGGRDGARGGCRRT